MVYFSVEYAKIEYVLGNAHVRSSQPGLGPGAATPLLHTKRAGVMSPCAPLVVPFGWHNTYWASG